MTAFRGGRLVDVLRNPGRLASVRPQDWEPLLLEADGLRLSGRLAHEAGRLGIRPPGPAGDRLEGLRLLSDNSDRAIRWEVRRIVEVLGDAGCPLVFLKGAAYLLEDLPFARGRRVADVDVLVAERDLGRAEAALREYGWELLPLEPYDERYYRLWTHELPPLRHTRRRIPVDVHHGLVPRTSRIRPDASRVLAQSRLVPNEGARVPSPAHLVLHAAIHLFHDGEIAGALRDLTDIDGLLRHFGQEPTFWDALQMEAAALDATRPVFYALRYTRRLLDTPVPPQVLNAVAEWAPGAAVLGLMDWLIEPALVHRGAGSRLPTATLRARAHWLRMPPMLLARHLTTKTLRRRLLPSQAH
jgi:hypothetical protein